MMMYVSTPNQGTLNLREKPNTKGMILKKISCGTVLDCEIVDDEWAKVSYEGETGYVMTKFLTQEIVNKPSITREDLQKVYDGLKEVLKTIENILK